MQAELWAEYNGTAGYVGRPASRERAFAEVADGTLGARQQRILSFLEVFGVMGATWKELADSFDDTDEPMHHGQVSGALSNLHKAGMVFMLKESRDRCHPYVHAKFRDRYTEDERYDEPARTRTTQRKELLEDLLTACRRMINAEFSWDDYQDVIDAVVMLNKHDGLTEE